MEVRHESKRDINETKLNVFPKDGKNYDGQVLRFRSLFALR